MSEALFEAKGLSKIYGPKNSGNYALGNFNLALPKGKIIGLLGPNGSGKTTLIKMAAGLLTPTEGEILIDGKKPGVETKGIVSYLPERTYLADYLSVEDTLNLFEDFYTDFDRDRAEKMLDNLHVNVKAKIRTLSKGTREKVQLVLVMSRRAKIYLLDEPIGGVDPAARDYILGTILSNYSEDSTIIISTHLIGDIEKILDEFVFVMNGQLICYLPTDKLREERGQSVDEYFREVFRC